MQFFCVFVKDFVFGVLQADRAYIYKVAKSQTQRDILYKS